MFFGARHKNTPLVAVAAGPAALTFGAMNRCDIESFAKMGTGAGMIGAVAMEVVDQSNIIFIPGEGKKPFGRFGLELRAAFF